MKHICITGGIACGKSSAGEMLREIGARVIDADDVCHELLQKDGPLIGRIVSVFGKKVLDQQGGIDRGVLGRIVFADEKARRKLNSLVHPEACRAINAWLGMQNMNGGEDKPRQNVRANMAAIIVPLAYEAGWTCAVDTVICVAAPLALQVARLKKKGLSEKDAKARIAAQMPLAEKMSRADYVIFNAGTLAGLRQQTALVFRNIREQWEKCYGRKK